MKQPSRFMIALALAACSGGPQLSAVERANAALRQGDRAGAYDELTAELCKGSADLDAARHLVSVWDELGRPATPMDRLARCSPAPVVPPYLRGLTLAAQGDHAAAALELAAAEALEPGTIELTYRRGIVLLGAGDGVAAAIALSQAVAAAPTRVDLRIALAQAQTVRGTPADAIATLRGLLALRPPVVELRRARLGLNAAVRAGEPALPPASADILKGLLGALERGEANAQTLAQATALATSTQHPRALTVAGLLALRLGAAGEGRELLSRAAEASPLDPDPPRALGVSLYAADRPMEALPYLRDAAHRDPFDADVARMLAAVSTARGDNLLARDAYLRLTVLEPSVVENHLWLARLERQRGDLVAARQAAERGCVLTPSDVPLLLERAAIEAQLYSIATSDDERSQARARTRNAVTALLQAAPEHPAAGAILESVQRN
jgi:tetratricopeptide (TPR) repeat protein